MGLPESIRVKLSSEAGGAVSITPVVVQDVPLTEIMELIVANTGKNPDRAAEILKRGSLVSGATRYRWSTLTVDASDLASLMARLPDAEPARPFVAGACVRAVLTGRTVRIELPRETAAKKKLFRRRSYWQVLISAAQLGAPVYVTYLHREKLDHYRLTVSPAVAAELREAGSLLCFRGLAAQVAAAPIESIDLYVARQPV